MQTRREGFGRVIPRHHRGMYPLGIDIAEILDFLLCSGQVNLRELRDGRPIKPVVPVEANKDLLARANIDRNGYAFVNRYDISPGYNVDGEEPALFQLSNHLTIARDLT